MSELAIITPSRGRPAQLADMARAAFGLADFLPDESTNLELWVGLDDDDDAAPYARHLGELPTAWRERIHVERGPRQSLSGWTNTLARKALDAPDPPRFLASLGDDHRPRTPAWARRLVDAIVARGGSGFSYGNDLLQGGKLPTAWVVSADIVNALGWLMLPSCEHMYVDNATLVLGTALDAIKYVPAVVIEHMHPVAGKAPVDESYAETNTAERYAADRAAFERWRASTAGLAADVERVREQVTA